MKPNKIPYKVWIRQTILDEIFSQGNSHLPKETGGILMGYSVSPKEFVITEIILAGEKAIHNFNSFQPDQEFHVNEIKRIYEESNGMITYLGDWHTHPNSYPYLSSKDKKTIKAIAQYKPARIATPLMLITAPPKQDFKIWVYKKNKNLIENSCSEGAIVCF